LEETQSVLACFWREVPITLKASQNDHDGADLSPSPAASGAAKATRSPSTTLYHHPWTSIVAAAATKSPQISQNHCQLTATSCEVAQAININDEEANTLRPPLTLKPLVFILSSIKWIQILEPAFLAAVCAAAIVNKEIVPNHYPWPSSGGRTRTSVECNINSAASPAVTVFKHEKTDSNLTILAFQQLNPKGHSQQDAARELSFISKAQGVRCGGKNETFLDFTSLSL
jgi:hypothetical protein